MGDAFDILPGDPTQLSLDGPRVLYARQGAYDTITLQLRDKYGNFTDLRSYAWHIETTNQNILETIPYPTQTTLGTSTTRVTSRGIP